MANNIKVTANHTLRGGNSSDKRQRRQMVALHLRASLKLPSAAAMDKLAAEMSDKTNGEVEFQMKPWRFFANQSARHWTGCL